jgi:hypothetical protein
MRARARLGAVVALAIGIGIASPIGCSSSRSLACPGEPSACPSLDGVTMFCAWADWGCTSEVACGGYFAVVDQAVDARFTYYYAARTGAYVATVREDFGGGDATCFNGPASFTPPASCAFTTLAACAPIAQEGGVEPVDASFDAAETGTPPGSPSSQPLARPPDSPANQPPK